MSKPSLLVTLAGGYETFKNYDPNQTVGDFVEQIENESEINAQLPEFVKPLVDSKSFS